jgi:hypothetical protein
MLTSLSSKLKLPPISSLSLVKGTCEQKFEYSQHLSIDSRGQFRRNDVTCRKIKKRVEKINTVFNRREQCRSIVEQHVLQVRAHTFYSCIHFCQYSHMIFRHDRRFVNRWVLHSSVCLSLCPSVGPHGTTRIPTDEFSRNFVFEYFFKNLSKKIKFY